MAHQDRLVVCLSLALLITSAAGAEIFVANASNNSVTVHAGDAGGDVAPLRTIAGPSTGLSTPYGLAVDLVNGEIVVSSFSSGEILVFPIDADGDVAPIRRFFLTSSGLSFAGGVCVDSVHDEIVVRPFLTAKIMVFQRSATGYPTPVRTISGELTTLADNTMGVAIDLVHDEIVVANRAGPDSAILFFDRTAHGNVAPVREISGSSTGINDPYGIAVDSTNNEVFVVNTPLQTMTVFDRSASGNVAPLRTLSDDGFNSLGAPAGVALDLDRGLVLVSNQSLNSISVFEIDDSGSPSPLRVLSGGSTLLSGPTLLDVQPALIFSDGFESGGIGAWSSPAL